MEERQLCCCGSRGWTLVTGWLHAIVGIWAFHDLGKIFFVLLESMKPDKKSHDEEERFSPAVLVQLGISVMLRILAIVGVSMAVILIRGCKNKNPKHLNCKFLLLLFRATGDICDTGRLEYNHGHHSKTWMQQQKSQAVNYLDTLS
ncbi:unnamed protein product [Allacma fusca]|uniref:Uncharacterized protein n=1 Tax=Allacma fusca TaxID=39272 RepID=A0A8J2KJA0_9HEXA|nr:unnamed protein product [Allacma fusca]